MFPSAQDRCGKYQTGGRHANNRDIYHQYRSSSLRNLRDLATEVQNLIRSEIDRVMLELSIVVTLFVNCEEKITCKASMCRGRYFEASQTYLGDHQPCLRSAVLCMI